MTVCQRWTEGRATYRPAGETIRPAEFEVAPIPDDTTARRFIQTHHYSRSFPSAIERHGLYRRGELVGVAVFSELWPHVVRGPFPSLTKAEVLELSRLVLLDEVRANGESWMLARSRELLRAEGYRGLLSFSDDQPRTTQAGERIFPGHIGTIYQASNAVYTGRGEGGALWLLPDGTAFHRKGWTKIRNAQAGWRGRVAHLVGYGAAELAEDAGELERRAWVDHWRAVLCRPLAHPGCHRYAWALDRRVAVALPPLAYPKLQRAA